MTQDGDAALEVQILDIQVIGGGQPSSAAEAALAIAVRQVITQRDARRAAPAPLWGAAGRREARDGLAIRSRTTLPHPAIWT